MAREVTHTATSPLKIDADDIDARKGNVAICRCGLSAEYPFCDGSHREIDEEPGTLYKYADDVVGERREIDHLVYVSDGTSPRE